MTDIEILIPTMGLRINGVERVLMPQREGVRYLVSWQRDGVDCPVPESLASRDDVRVVELEGKGVSRNRNNLILNAKAPLCFMADDDVVYHPDGFAAVVKLFEDDAQVDFATFCYHSDEYPKYYPSEEFVLPNYPKNYYVNGFEIAFRLESVKAVSALFDERYGLGAPVLQAAEELVWVEDACAKGLTGRFFPIVVTTHADATTCLTRMQNPGVIMAEGAYIMRHFRKQPWQLAPRMALKARRVNRQTRLGFFKILRLLLRGGEYEVKTAR